MRTPPAKDADAQVGVGGRDRGRRVKCGGAAKTQAQCVYRRRKSTAQRNHAAAQYARRRDDTDPDENEQRKKEEVGKERRTRIMAMSSKWGLRRRRRRIGVDPPRLQPGVLSCPHRDTNHGGYCVAFQRNIDETRKRKRKGGADLEADGNVPDSHILIVAAAATRRASYRHACSGCCALGCARWGSVLPCGRGRRRASTEDGTCIRHARAHVVASVARMY
jgi:hypothetical protein